MEEVTAENIDDLLREAFRQHNLEQVTALLEKIPDINAPRGRYRSTPIADAAYWGHIEGVQLLIEKGANVNACGKDSDPALVRAVSGSCRELRVKMCRLLLQHGANINQCGDAGLSPLLSAAGNDDCEMLKLLLDNGAKVNHVADGNLTNSLLRAARAGHVNIVNMLLAHGAKVNYVNCRGETPLGVAIESGHYDVVVALVKNGAKVDNKFMEALFSKPAVSPQIVEFILKESLNSRDEESFNAWIIHCIDFRFIFEMSLRCAELALKTRLFERNTLENMMESALKHMLWLDGGDWVPLLGNDVHRLVVCLHVLEEYFWSSKREAVLNFSNFSTARTLGCLFLISCPQSIASTAFPKTKEFLIKALDHKMHIYNVFVVWNDADSTRQFGRYFNLVDAYIKMKILSADYFLTTYGEFVNRLFQYWRKINNNAMAFWKIGKLHKLPHDAKRYLMRHVRQPSMQLIANAGINFSTVWNKGLDSVSVFKNACETGNAPLVRLLFAMGVTADLDYLQLAVEKGHTEVVCLFLENGADVNGFVGNTELTVLSTAVFHGQAEVVRVLLEKGSDIHKCNKDGTTSLNTALDRGNINIVRMLLENGAKVNGGPFPPLYFMLKESMRDYIRDDGFNDPELIVSVIKLLLKYGARIDQAAKSIVKDKPEILALLEQTEAKRAATTFMGVGNKYKRGIFASPELTQLPRDVARYIGKMIKASSPAA